MSYDIVVIGAGSVGTPAAFYFAREGLKVLVIDRLPSPGQGSNKAAIGGVRATHSDPAKIRLGLRTIEILTSFEEEFGYDVEWRPGGYVFVAYRPRRKRPSAPSWISSARLASISAGVMPMSSSKLFPT